MIQVALLAGVARSGTSWLGQILDSSPDVCFRFQPFFSYAFKDHITHKATKRDFAAFFQALLESNDSFLLQQDKREKGLYPVFEKSPIPSLLILKENRYQYLFPKIFSFFENFKMICIIRNPCAVINSWVKSPKEFPPNANIENEWRFGACKNEGKEENFFGFYKWREATDLYLDLKDKHPNNVYIIQYENLVDNPIRETEKIFHFLNIDFPEQTKKFIKSSNSKHIEGQYSVFKNKSVKDAWRHELPKSIVDEIYFELSGTRLENFLM